MEQVIRLTHKEEVEILNYLKKQCELTNNSFNSGSSRVAVKIQWNGCIDGSQEFFNKLNERFGTNGSYYNTSFMVKIAFGAGGMNQNILETSAYENYGSDAPIAKIYAVGDVIEIMEVLTLADEAETLREDGIEYGDWEDYDDYLYNTYSPVAYKLLNRALLEEMFNTMWELANYFGQTSDNAQLGLNEDGEILCYDYGYNLNSDEYNSDKEEDSLIGSAGMIWNETDFTYALKKITELIETTPEGEYLKKGEYDKFCNALSDKLREERNKPKKSN